MPAKNPHTVNTVPDKSIKKMNTTVQAALNTIVNTDRWNIENSDFQAHCRQELCENGVIVLPDFLTTSTVKTIQSEGDQHRQQAYFTKGTHNVYLTPNDDNYPDKHPRNRQVTSSKGCITTDQIPTESPLHALYENATFKDFLCKVLDEDALHEYADALSSINLHYAAQGQELGWHFDNSSFAITLLVQKPDDGGVFEYVEHLRGENNPWNFDAVESVLDGNLAPKSLSMDPGCLVLFRGRNALHRVTPTIGDTTRMLAVLAYNSERGIALSESARMTFYGRT